LLARSAVLAIRAPPFKVLFATTLMEDAPRFFNLHRFRYYLPNPYYIPDDPCEVLFWDPTMEMRFEEASLVLSDKFGFPENRAEELREGTFGALIERVSVKDNRSHR